MDTLGISLFASVALASIASATLSNIDKLSERYYAGSCHCGKVTFSVKSTKHLYVWDCNCSICYMKKNWHFIVPEKNFHLITGSEYLTAYAFNTKVAKHMFCNVCGVQAFYRPRSNPDGYAVTLACIKQDQVRQLPH
jgi:hypothetical protein